MLGIQCFISGKIKGGKVQEKVYAPDSLQEGRISFSVKNREKSLYYCHLATIFISSSPLRPLSGVGMCPMMYGAWLWRKDLNPGPDLSSISYHSLSQSSIFTLKLG